MKKVSKEILIKTAEAWKAEDIKVEGDKITMTLDVTEHYDEDACDVVSSFLSICSLISCTQWVMKITNWIWKDASRESCNKYVVEFREDK